MLRGLFKDVQLSADAHAERRHQLLADGVQGRVAHLGEELLEVAEEELGPLREHGQGRVVAHGAHGLRANSPHGFQQHTEILLGVPEGLLQVYQTLGVHAVMDVLGLGQFFQPDHVVLEPLAVGTATGQL